jgi:hypothetical protein
MRQSASFILARSLWAPSARKSSNIKAHLNRSMMLYLARRAQNRQGAKISLSIMVHRVTRRRCSEGWVHISICAKEPRTAYSPVGPWARDIPRPRIFASTVGYHYARRRDGNTATAGALCLRCRERHGKSGTLKARFREGGSGLLFIVQSWGATWYA